MKAILEKNKIKTALVAAVAAVVVWGFAAALQEVLYPLLKGVSFAKGGGKLFMGLGRMFAIYFVKNMIIAALVGGAPLFFAFLGMAACREKGACLVSRPSRLFTGLLVTLLILGLLVAAGHFTSLVSFKYALSYLKAFVAIAAGVLAGSCVTARRRTRSY